jgi:hypothetical protein
VIEVPPDTYAAAWKKGCLRGLEFAKDALPRAWEAEEWPPYERRLDEMLDEIETMSEECPGPTFRMVTGIQVVPRADQVLIPIRARDVAELIVRLVNAEPEIVAALEQIVSNRDGWPHECAPACTCSSAIAERALAKVRP